MITDKKSAYVTELFDQIAPTYDGINRILSMGIDKMWRKAMLKHIPQKPNQVLVDLATGTADQIIAMAKSPFVEKLYGFDLSTQMLLLGQEKLIKKKLDKKSCLQIGNALAIPLPDQFCDIATISFGIRNVQDPLKCLQEMHRILKPGGICCILEFSLPPTKIVRATYLLYLRHILPKIGTILSKNREAYTYLNTTIESFPSGEAFLRLMHTAGFSSCKATPLTLGIASLYLGAGQTHEEINLHRFLT